MYKINYQTWIIALLVILNISTLAFMWINKPPRPEMPQETNYREKANHYMQNKLRFSPAQTDEFRRYQEEHFEQMRTYRTQTMALKKELYRLDYNETNEPKINALVMELSKIYAEQEKSHFLHIQQLRSICTPEQLPAMEKMLARIIFHNEHNPHQGKRQEMMN